MDKLKTKLDDVTKEERARARELWQAGNTVFEIARELGIAINVVDRIVKTGAVRKAEYELAKAELALAKAEAVAAREARKSGVSLTFRDSYEAEMRYIEVTERLIGLVMPDGGTPDEALERVAALVEAARAARCLVAQAKTRQIGLGEDFMRLRDALCAAGFEV